MSEEFIKKIEDLISNGKGDKPRLEHILNSIKKGKTLFSSDQKYLETIIEEHVSKESKSEIQTDSDKKPTEVEELQKKVKDLEQKVEKKDISDSWKQDHYKSLGLAAGLAFLIGFVLFGMGHFYAGKKKSGFGWLIGGIILGVVSIFAYATGGVIAGYAFGGLYLILNIVQTINAVNYCKEWNLAVSQKIIPW